LRSNGTSSARHIDHFEADPIALAPRPGGYCAKALSSGFSGVGNPEARYIEDGERYFFFSSRARERWIAELDNGIMARSETNWDNRHRP